MALRRPDLLTLDEAAEVLGVCTVTIRRRIADGSLRAYRVGPRLIKVDADDLHDLIRPLRITGGAS